MCVPLTPVGSVIRATKTIPASSVRSAMAVVMCHFVDGTISPTARHCPMALATGCAAGVPIKTHLVVMWDSMTTGGSLPFIVSICQFIKKAGTVKMCSLLEWDGV